MMDAGTVTAGMSALGAGCAGAVGWALQLRRQLKREADESARAKATVHRAEQCERQRLQLIKSDEHLRGEVSRLEAEVTRLRGRIDKARPHVPAQAQPFLQTNIGPLYTHSPVYGGPGRRRDDEK